MPANLQGVELIPGNHTLVFCVSHLIILYLQVKKDAKKGKDTDSVSADGDASDERYVVSFVTAINLFNLMRRLARY